MPGEDLYERLELWLSSETCSWIYSKVIFFTVLEDYSFFTWSIGFGSGDTPDRREEWCKSGAAMYFFTNYLDKTYMDMLNAMRFKDLTDAQFSWLGLTAVTVSVFCSYQ